MKFYRKPKFHYVLIAIALFFTFLPVILAHNYIRQDDLMWEIWPGMKMSDFGYLYHNTIFQLVRPICMISFYLTDLISLTITPAVYVRLMSVLLLSVLGVMLYRWQVKYLQNRKLAMAFAICAFTLPPYQIFAATGNYSLILTALVMTFGAMFCWHRAWFESTHRLGWYAAGCALFFASLLDYPLSSMYVWAMVLIVYLNTLFSLNRQSERGFMLGVAFSTLFLMGFYYLCCRVFHFIHHVDVAGGRAAVIDTANLMTRLLGITEVAGWHSELWWWDNTDYLADSGFYWILGLYVMAVARLNWSQSVRNWRWLSVNVVEAVVVAALCFFLAYLPVMASPDRVITFRYALVTMPIFLYLILWSGWTLIDSFALTLPTPTKIAKWAYTAGLAALTVYTMGFANLMIADGIVGPHERDFAYIQQQITEQVIPALKQNKQVVIHAIACDESEKPHAPNLPFFIEYSMRTCQYQQQVIGVIIHSMAKFGYPSNYGQHNDVLYHDKEIVVNNTPWGTLVVNSPSNASNDLTPYSDNHQRTIVTIDTRMTPTYQQYDFYRQVFGKSHA